MAFVLRFSLYEFTLLMCSLYNTPSIIWHLVKYVVSNIIDLYVLVHLGEILVYSKTANNH